MVLYQDSKPVLRDKSYRRETYLESVVARVGGKCPNCGRTLQVTPTSIEVSAPRQRSVSQGKRRTLSLVFAEP